jgi:uncharacterized membrane protein
MRHTSTVLPVGSMLAGNADRERAVDVLRAGFAEGRLTQEEFTDRIEHAYASRTYDELGGLTADLPAGPLPMAAVAMGTASLTPEPTPGEIATRSFAGLVLTAIVMFTFAVLLTAVAVYMHTHSGVGAPSAPVHLLPFIQHHAF